MKRMLSDGCKFFVNALIKRLFKSNICLILCPLLNEAV